MRAKKLQRKGDDVMEFEKYLNTMFSDTQVEILRLCLKNNSPIHIYGPQGSGKTMLVDGLKSVGFNNISKPGNLAEEYPTGPDYIPVDVENITALRIKERSSELWIEKQTPFRGHAEETRNWVYSLLFIDVGNKEHT